MNFKYLLDSNVFIEAYRNYYPMDLFPKFWEWLESMNQKENICSTESIYEEIEDGKDELANWVKDRKKGEWFLPDSDLTTQQNYSDMATWIMGEKYKPHAKFDFLSKADLWLIAKAKTIGITVVTQEKSEPNSKRKIFIPDVCNNFGVSTINTIEMIRRLGGKF